MNALKIAFVSLTLVATGCAEFFQLPPDRSSEIALSTRDWPNKSEVSSPIPLCRIEAAVKKLCIATTDQSSSEPNAPLVAHFLHLSDAQIRDETVYKYQGNLQEVDSFINVTVRRPLVEEYDVLTLASFLAAYNAEVRSEVRSRKLPNIGKAGPFLIHTGDLLDLSVITELMDALKVLGYWHMGCAQGANRGYPIYSVGGNHDGLLFGNIPQRTADTQDIGVNQSEFVLGHILYQHVMAQNEDKSCAGGFGFSQNELIRRWVEKASPLNSENTQPSNKSKSDNERWEQKSREALEAAVERTTNLEIKDPQSIREIIREAQTFKHAIRVPTDANETGLSLGYYSWIERTPHIPNDAGVDGIRFIVLDTRARVNDEGDLDYVQRGWLYKELCDALEKRKAVVIFAHHQPSKMRGLVPSFREWLLFRRGQFSNGAGTLQTMLDAFPNIIAFFYGHEHENSERTVNRSGAVPSQIAMIQTGSLADAPQVGRLVKIRSRPSNSEHAGNSLSFEAEIEWEFVRPFVDVAEPDGLRLASRLRASRKEADLEARETWPRKLVNSSRFGHWVPKAGWPSTPEQAAECETTGKEKFSDNRLPKDRTLKVQGYFPEQCPTVQEILGCRWPVFDQERRSLGLEGIVKEPTSTSEWRPWCK